VRSAVRLVLFSLAIAILYLSSGCVYFHRESATPKSYTISPNTESTIAALLEQEPLDLERALLIEDPQLALSSRIELIEAADKSIDLQYFIWKNDATGILLIQSLIAAADRGVRIRGLLDDIELEGLTGRIRAINSHPNIEIRIFNPFSIRTNMRLGVLRLTEFMVDGMRLNHRMHNKLLIVDNQAAILGGRNIGDEYFGKGSKRNFIDSDILISGSIIPELSDGFDAYWNSALAQPVKRMVNLSLSGADLDRIRERILKRLSERPDLERLSDGNPDKGLFTTLANGPKLNWSASVIDDPNVGWFNNPDESARPLTEIALSAQREVLIVTPYLIPTDNLLSIAETLIERGVRIAVLTNSLASNDAVIAQAAYGRFREKILKIGVELYEMRGDPAFIENDSGIRNNLHSKFLLFDEQVVFIGSLNLDPRSLYLNTELGVVLNSEELSQTFRNSFELMTRPDNAWRVERTPEGILWSSSAGTLKKPPAKSQWQRFSNNILSLIPISNQL